MSSYIPNPDDSKILNNGGYAQTTRFELGMYLGEFKKLVIFIGDKVKGREYLLYHINNSRKNNEKLMTTKQIVQNIKIGAYHPINHKFILAFIPTTQRAIITTEKEIAEVFANNATDKHEKIFNYFKENIQKGDRLVSAKELQKEIKIETDICTIKIMMTLLNIDHEKNSNEQETYYKIK